MDPLTNNLLGPNLSNLGLAQGSPVSPILFNIFVRDVHRFLNIPGLLVLKYADDTALMISAPSVSSALQQMSNALTLVEKWASYKHLQLSPEKSLALCFHQENEGSSAFQTL